MKAISQSTLKYFSLKNRHNWSDNRFAWFYAVIILIAVAVFAVFLKMAGIYESMAWRVINIFFIAGGQSAMIIDYKMHKDSNLEFTHAALLCIRSGFYFALLFLPTLAFALGGYASEQEIINQKELFGTNNLTVQSAIFVNWIETIATLSVLSFAVPHVVCFVRTPKKES